MNDVRENYALLQDDKAFEPDSGLVRPSLIKNVILVT